MSRLKSLQTMARRRGYELHEVTSERMHDPETNELELEYWLFLLDYKDPVVFDDLDEVEFDLKSRSSVERAAWSRT
jgi:hypothetical protein